MSHPSPTGGYSAPDSYWNLSAESAIVEGDFQVTSRRFTSPASPLLDASDMADLLGLPDRRAVYKRMARGNFPPAIRLGDRSLRWRWSDVDDFLDGRYLPDDEVEGGDGDA